MRVPLTFKIGGLDYTVQPLEATYRSELRGEHRPEDSAVYLDPTLKPQILLGTFFHELVHSLLEAAGREDLSENEAFVDTFSTLLHQFMKTKRGKFPAE